MISTFAHSFPFRGAISNIAAQVWRWMRPKAARDGQEAPPIIEPLPPPHPDPNDIADAEPLFATRGFIADGVIDQPDAKISDGNLGEMLTMGSLLEDLDHYRRYIRRLRMTDENAYDLFSKIGFVMCSEHGLYEGHRLDPMVSANPPTFGGVVLGKSDGEDDTIKFIYFTKYKVPPPGVQSIAGADIYVVDVIYDIDGLDGNKGIKHPVNCQFAVAVKSEDVIMLRVKEMTRQELKNGAGITHRQWRVPSFLAAQAKRHNETPEDVARNLFCFAVNAWTSISSSIIRVAAEKDGLTMVFAVDTLKVPEFFKDRDPVITPNGRKARIFHIVKAHPRRLKDGRTIGIKTHFAGARRFKWKGNDISISVPGWHHFNIAEFNVGAVDESALPRGKYHQRAFMRTSALANHLLAEMKSGTGGRARQLRRLH